MKTCRLALTTVLSTACGAGWRRSDWEIAPLHPRQQVQVWRGGTATQWHAVVITPDSVSGIAFYRPAHCDSCRVSLPRAQVDSMRLGDPVEGFWKTVGLVFGGLLAIMVAVCIETGSWPNCFPTEMS